MDERTRKRLAQLNKELVDLVPYDPAWAGRYAEIEAEIKTLVPRMIMLRIAHIGSTAVPGLSAKPVIDVQVEVNDVDALQHLVVPRMEEAGYEFIWRPTMGDADPYYAWFIKRDEHGGRTVHVHMVRPGQASVDRIIFRDHLRDHPEEARRYEELKHQLAKRYHKDRDGYTSHKADFVREVLAKARREKMKR